MASLANDRLARAPAAPGLILPPPGPCLDPPLHRDPIKRSPSPATPPLCHRPHTSHRFLLCATSKLPWSSPLRATPHSRDFAARFATPPCTSSSSPWPPRRRRCAGTPTAPPPAKLRRRRRVPIPSGHLCRPNPAKPSSGKM
uniref:Uncharacterized protein n=1 Tax=Setaria viridis TaxID=4556 RepID=A0A4U6UF26_SETVI|nr:hypothetical protein SEVIR_5G181200v2 [Setaria viridis]